MSDKEKQIIKVGNREIQLDDNLLRFDEHTINNFLQTFAANYNYYYEFHSDATFIHSKYEDKYDAIYADKFRMYREESSSDKMAEMKTKCDAAVQEAQENVRVAKRNVNLLWGYLRALDRAHDDATQYCFNLRREMQSLFPKSL